MLVIDNNLLSDYLDGRRSAARFLEEYERMRWAVPSIVLYEAFMGSLHGFIGGSPDQIHQAVTTSMDVLDVTERTALAACTLQEELRDRGTPAEHPDALIAAAAKEHGGVFATADEFFWTDDVSAVLEVAPYERT